MWNSAVRGLTNFSSSLTLAAVPLRRRKEAMKTVKMHLAFLPG
jgi:hypothetical protein